MNVIQFNEAKGHLLKKRYLPHLRTLGDFFEYCVIPEYDEILDNESIERVKVDDVRVHLAKVDGRFLLASILFEKAEFHTSSIANWLFNYAILIEHEARDEHSIENALDLVRGITFDGQPLVKYSKGPYEVFYYPNEFEEVLETFDQLGPTPVDFGAAEYDGIE